MTSGATIVPIPLNHVETLIDWARGEGWSPGPMDGPCFHSADQDGFFGAFIGEKLVGGISAVRYGSRFGFIGLLIVHPDFRGKDIGLKLAKAAIEHLGDRVMGEDGVLDQEKNYHKIFGFESAHKQARYLGKASSLQSFQSHGLDPTGEMVALTRIPGSVLNGFDSLYFPGPRATFLRNWIHAKGHKGVAYLQGHPVKSLMGYGVIRPSAMGHKIGPLFAKNPTIAQALLVQLTSDLKPEDPVIWDIPEPNRPAVRIAHEAGMETVFETVRMYKNGQVSIKPETVYGITSFELG